MKQLRIAKILTESRVVINAGRDENIKPGDEFVIYEIGDEIRDPETSEALDNLEIVKGQVQAIDVQPKLTIAERVNRTVQRTRVVNPFKDLLAGFPRKETYEVDVPDQMTVESVDDTYKRALVVRVGDLVRKMTK